MGAGGAPPRFTPRGSPVFERLPAVNRRLAPEEMFPAGLSGYRVSYISLSGGERVRVVETGFSRGRPVVFLHGWGGSAWSFNRALPVVAAAGFRAIAFDLRGHGLSDKPSGDDSYTTEAMVAQVVGVMDGLSLERPAVVAHSMGGAIATHIGLRHRERIRALVLLGPIGFGESRAAALARRVTPPWTDPLLSAGFRRWVVDRILRRIYGDAGSYDQRDVDEYWAPGRFGGFVPAMRALVHHFRWTPFTWEELLELRTRCLLIRGERDPVVRPLAGEDLARYANAREAVIRDAGHVVHDEVAAEVNGTVLRFLDDAWRS